MNPANTASEPPDWELGVQFIVPVWELKLEGMFAAWHPLDDPPLLAEANATGGVVVPATVPFENVAVVAVTLAHIMPTSGAAVILKDGVVIVLVTDDWVAEVSEPLSTVRECEMSITTIDR